MVFFFGHARSSKAAAPPGHGNVQLFKRRTNMRKLKFAAISSTVRCRNSAYSKQSQDSATSPVRRRALHGAATVSVQIKKLTKRSVCPCSSSRQPRTRDRNRARTADRMPGDFSGAGQSRGPVRQYSRLESGRLQLAVSTTGKYLRRACSPPLYSSTPESTFPCKSITGRRCSSGSPIMVD